MPRKEHCEISRVAAEVKSKTSGGFSIFRSDAGLPRVVIVNADRCKPSRCELQCKKICVSNQIGNLCIEVSKSSTTTAIHEDLCSGCGACTRAGVCPFSALTIVNIPADINSHVVHRYSGNGFRLKQLCTPKLGEVVGLLGENGLGKSTALKILCGHIMPNLGEEAVSWEKIIKSFRGSSLQGYFTQMASSGLQVAMRPQHIAALKLRTTGDLAMQEEAVQGFLSRNDERGEVSELIVKLELGRILDRNLSVLSGGEMQRVLIAATIAKRADVFIFDEPSSFLDVRQRVVVAKMLRELARSGDEGGKYVLIADHDLIFLELAASSVCLLYGAAPAYGVVTSPSRSNRAINSYLRGYVPCANLRFRDHELTFRLGAEDEETIGAAAAAAASKQTTVQFHDYPEMKKTVGGFVLNVEAGKFSPGQIVCLVGGNGCGKSTLLRLLSSKERPDTAEGEQPDECGLLPHLRVSCKPQHLSSKFQGTVEDLLNHHLGGSVWRANEGRLSSDVVKPLKILPLLPQKVTTLSGGELQRVALALCLGLDADLYLIDEPSAHLDVEQRIVTAKVLKRWISHKGACCFVVEHDILLAAHMASRIIVHQGIPGIRCTASAPLAVEEGISRLLHDLDITFRRDKHTGRARANRQGSSRDLDQKRSGVYFSLDN